MRPRLIAAALICLALPMAACAQEPFLWSGQKPAFTGSDAEVLARAEAAFRKGVENKAYLFVARKHFSEATDAYRELHRRGVRSAALYANLGNAAVLADRWPEAIWAYHTGLKLEPDGQAMRAHLAFARAKVIYPPAGQGRPDADSWPDWLRRPKIDNLAWVLAAVYGLTWFTAGCAFLLRRRQFFVFAGISIAFTVVLGVALWHELRQADIDRKTPLVVLVENTPFQRGNDSSYPQHPAVPLLPRGLEARQQHRRGNWLQIRLATGELGWVHAANVLIVAP
jgi:hypothetical protein